MNDLIGNNYEPTEDQLKAKKWMKIIGIILAILFLIGIVLVVLMLYVQASQLKISIDGVSTPNLGNILIIEENEVYIPIREFASYVGYESNNGAYKQYEEGTTNCYVRCADEIASFTMNSDKIYKLLLAETEEDYEYFTINEPVKMINGALYVSSEGAEKAFNISFTYDREQNSITIYTLPYLVTYWASQFPNSDIAEDSASFSNQKALLYNMIIVKNADEYYGVYDLTGKEILGTKYTSIEFVESTMEFIVTTEEGKMGIISYDATTKIRPEYDEIKQIDKDAGLYLVTNNNKQGVLNNSGNVVVYLEYDQIGIDIDKYDDNNNIKNQYLLYDNCIPVKRDNKWGMFDKTGRQILPLEYDNFGCDEDSATGGSSVLLIPDYEGIVVKQGEFYGLVDSQGEELLPVVLSSIYSMTSGGEKTYYMIYNNVERDLIDYIKKYVRPESSTPTNNTNTTNNTNVVDNTQTTNSTVNEQVNSNQTDNTVQNVTSNTVTNTPITNNGNITQ